MMYFEGNPTYSLQTNPVRISIPPTGKIKHCWVCRGNGETLGNKVTRNYVLIKPKQLNIYTGNKISNKNEEIIYGNKMLLKLVIYFMI